MADARAGFTIYIVDDDAPIRDSLTLLFSLRGYRSASFASAEDFLAAYTPDWKGCLITDIRLPGMSGLALQQELNGRGAGLPIIIITGHGDVPAARAAFKFQAVDFLEKPFDSESPLAAVEAAFQLQEARACAQALETRQRETWSMLTQRERDVATLVISGLHNRDVAEKLGISPRTVEVHKARIMEKVGARNLAELIRLSGGARP